MDNTPNVPEYSSILSEKITPFSTLQILMYLFKKSMRSDLLDDQTTQELTAVDVTISKNNTLIQKCLGLHLQKQITEEKAQLNIAKDSPERKRILGEITELDGKIINFSLQGETLKEKLKKITDRFTTFAKTNINAKKEINHTELEKIKTELKQLEDTLNPYEETFTAMEKEVEKTKKDTEKLTGRG